MIFDDDTDLLEVCGMVLKAKGHTVIGMDNCNALIENIKRFSPNVILMDNWIPEIGGVNAIHLIKADRELNSVPVILFSANDDIRELAREANADFFLQKPFEIDDLETTVSRAILSHVTQTGPQISLPGVEINPQ